MVIIKRVVDLIQREPALFVGLVAAALTLAAAFGLNVGDKQQAAIMAFVQIVVSVIVRSQVSPVPPKPAA